MAAAGALGVGAAVAGAPASKDRHLTIFYTAEAHGTLEPCGCTSDPLGDVARYASVVRAARKTGDAILVDAGGLSFPEGGASARERAGNALRASFLATELGKLGLHAVGLADTDLAAGPAAVRPARLAANVAAGGPIAPSVLESAGGVKVGVFGVVDPALSSTLGAKVDEPVAAARREAERLRKAGAELVVALAPVDRAVARRIAREAAVDFVVLGRQVAGGAPRADAVGHAFLVSPADELQRVGRIDVVLRAGSPALVDAGGAEATQLRLGEIDYALGRLDDELARWEKSGGDATFVASKRQERASLAAERGRLTAAPWSAPATGSYFTNQLVPLRRSLPRDPAIAAAMKKLDAEIGKLNLKDAPPPAPREPGRAYYVGMDKCVSCHEPAGIFWRGTVHAQAWKTLVDVGKQADYKCVSCHVTGYGEVGGTSLGFTKKLENIQCEQCHGPGSAHVAGEGLESPPAIQLDVPSSVCTTCHNEHHSDTFNYNAYLRDVVGPGHGMSLRKKLGDGPTGRTLRRDALAKAKAAGAATLKKI
ncbi:MAG TPA: multiheme c-type cytochrome [Polyangia bacterium]|nr:multiheme c-type cytochrome [Polyangia bacterium]